MDAVEWLRREFSEDEIRRVLRTERRLTPKSANFWRLVYDIPTDEIAALKAENSPLANASVTLPVTTARAIIGFGGSTETRSAVIHKMASPRLPRDHEEG